MEPTPQPEAYLVYVWIREVHPLRWRRFLVQVDKTLADLLWSAKSRLTRCGPEKSIGYPSRRIIRTRVSLEVLEWNSANSLDTQRKFFLPA